MTPSWTIRQAFSLATLLTTAVATATVCAAGYAAEYKVDNSHSKVGFSVRHLMSRVSGEFSDYTATFQFDPEKLTFGEAKLEVAATSINTGNSRRDDHLRSPDFFDVKKYPKITASAGKVTAKDKNQFEWATDLTLHGVTKPVVFTVEYLGAGKDARGSDVVGFQAKTKINRRDFGLNWSKTVETGGLVVGDDVEITLDIEGVRQDTKSAKK